jgi:hypothetical protein
VRDRAEAEDVMNEEERAVRAMAAEVAQLVGRRVTIDPPGHIDELWTVRVGRWPNRRSCQMRVGRSSKGYLVISRLVEGSRRGGAIEPARYPLAWTAPDGLTDDAWHEWLRLPRPRPERIVVDP